MKIKQQRRPLLPNLARRGPAKREMGRGPDARCQSHKVASWGAVNGANFLGGEDGGGGGRAREPLILNDIEVGSVLRGGLSLRTAGNTRLEFYTGEMQCVVGGFTLGQI